MPPRIVALDELEEIPVPGSRTWRPVRHALGVRAFGCNAYTAREAGQPLVPPHNERYDPSVPADEAHEELYFVASGSARFTIDGEDHDAPSGTYVFIPDPESMRQAVALEPGTTLLTFGAPPTFEPSPWEWAYRAAAQREDDPQQALAILLEGLETHPGSTWLLYDVACLHATEGRVDEAMESLRRAAAADPAGIREWASEDSDLDSLRELPEFRELLAGGPD